MHRLTQSMFQPEVKWLKSNDWDEILDVFDLGDRTVNTRVLLWGEKTNDMIQELRQQLTYKKHRLDLNWHVISTIIDELSQTIRNVSEEPTKGET